MQIHRRSIRGQPIRDGPPARLGLSLTSSNRKRKTAYYDLLYTPFISSSHLQISAGALTMAGLNSLPFVTGMFHLCEVIFGTVQKKKMWPGDNKYYRGLFPIKIFFFLFVSPLFAFMKGIFTLLLTSKSLDRRCLDKNTFPFGPASD
jgi:hypothetical protein